MEEMKSIQLEILRHGPAHNLLLSPLTRYIALCGTQSPITFTIPYEHRDYLIHLNALRYKDDKKGDIKASEHKFHIDEIQKMVTGILENIEGFTTEIASYTNNKPDMSCTEKNWLHLRLVINPLELSMLPFEMSKSFQCFPAKSLPLLLNPSSPIVITREIRQPMENLISWPRMPKILLVAAQPDGVPPIPLEAHALAIRKALDPWVKPKKGMKDKPDVSDLLKILPNASIDDIKRACRKENYTHVHILAHGDEFIDGTAKRFGLALFNNKHTNKEVVSGERLAFALRCLNRNNTFSFPTVVTVASCDSGNINNVVEPGASLAHSLHEVGIPFILASQYPLSVPGSVIMVNEFYNHILKGFDPRIALFHVRQALYLRLPHYHDWASLVAYARLPENISDQMRDVELEGVIKSMEITQEWAEMKIKIDNKTKTEKIKEKFDYASKKLENSCIKLQKIHDSYLNEKLVQQKRLAEIRGLLGSACKRRAELDLRKAKEIKEGQFNKKKFIETLEESRKWYNKAWTEMIGHHWSTVQDLFLTAVLKGNLYENKHKEEWVLAKLGAQSDAKSNDRETKAWAFTSLAEIYLLEPLTLQEQDSGIWKRAQGNVQKYLDELVEFPGKKSIYLKLTMLQFERYYLWCHILNLQDPFKRIAKIAKRLFDIYT